ncbi:SHOCT domain-containing protein [Camelliibacillus cellulosilyticus]|uniref:SHOCT domain-containing protein n=1 Tax=Camelliibacillus cellulosilyticus TaxID=2174486 RepID=A0ABV9GKU1_9BACL
MGAAHHAFSFYPFGALFCLTLFCFTAISIFANRYRYRDAKQQNDDMISILKKRMARGDIDEAEYQKLKDLLSK